MQPVGLLTLLGIKQNGQYPADLLNELRGTIDLFDWYQEQSIQITQTAPFAIGAGSTSSAAVFGPATVWTWVERYSAIGATAAGDIQDFALTRITRPGAIPVIHSVLATLPYSPLAAGRGVFLGCGGFFLPPGESLGYVAESTAGGGSVSFSLRFTNLS